MTHKICPRCSRPITHSAPQGLCPNCLLAGTIDVPELIVTNGGEAHPSPPTPEGLQSLFPQLEIVRLIGRGGMGAVYEARQRGLGRTVALKLLWAPPIPDAAFEERFLREGRALAQLAHDNIVTVHDAGKAGPYYWILMEHINGPNLRRIIQAGPIDPPKALRIVMQMCAAIDYAHRQGVVHRDIKPENVLVTRQGRVKIADFGLAKLLEHDAKDATLTRSLQAMGTPHYMAPEQVERPKEVDHRADIYSLGVVLYEVLTGELPLGRFEMPSRQVDVSSRLDEIVTKALQKQPERRYQAASEVGTAVRNVAERKPASPARTGRVPRSKANVGLVVGVVAVLAMIGVFALINSAGVFASEEGRVPGAAERFALGQSQIQSEATFQAGLSNLEAAFESDPTLPGLEDELVRAMRKAVEASRPEEALRLATKVRKLAPSSDSGDLVGRALARVQAEWRQIVVSEPAEGSLLTSVPATLKGRVEPFPSGVTLWNGSQRLDVVASEFTCALPSTMPDGKFIVPLSVRLDAETQVPLPITFTVDTQRPELRISGPRGGASVSKLLRIEGTVSDAATTCSVMCNGEPARVDEAGNWSVDLRLGNGEQQLTVVARDGAGREQLETRTVIVDSQPPMAFCLSFGVERACSAMETVALKPGRSEVSGRLAARDDHRLVSATWDGRPARIGSDGVLAGLSVDPSSTGTTTHELHLIDEAGNPVTYSVRVRRDGKPPVVQFPLVTDAVIVGQSYVLSGQVLDDSPCIVKIAGRTLAVEGHTLQVPITIANDTSSLAFRVIDEAGNSTSLLSKGLQLVDACKARKCGTIEGKPGRCTDCRGSGLNPDATCPTCQGRREQSIHCDHCKGKGNEPCIRCRGSGNLTRTECGQCGGVGRYSCTNQECDAKGEVRVKCWDCKGSGLIPRGRLKVAGSGPCETCGGRKTLPGKCKTCLGDKQIDCKLCIRGVDCGDCGNSGSSRMPCNVCKGARAVSRTCTDCQGTGSTADRPCASCIKGACKKCSGTGQARQ